MIQLIDDVNYYSDNNLIVKFKDSTTLKLNSQKFTKTNYSTKNIILGSVNYNKFIIELRNSAIYINYNKNYNIIYNIINNTISVMYKNVQFINYICDHNKLSYVNNELKIINCLDQKIEYKSNYYTIENGFFECFTTKNIDNLHYDNNVYRRIFCYKDNLFTVDDLSIHVNLLYCYTIYMTKIFSTVNNKKGIYDGVSVLHTHRFNNNAYENLFNNHNNNTVVQSKYLVNDDSFSIIKNATVLSKSLFDNNIIKCFYSSHNKTNTMRISLVLQITKDCEEKVKYYMNVNIMKVNEIREIIPHYISENNNTIFFKFYENNLYYRCANNINYKILFKHNHYVNFEHVGNLTTIHDSPIKFMSNFAKELFKNTKNNDEKLLNYIAFIENSYNKNNNLLTKYDAIIFKT